MANVKPATVVFPDEARMPASKTFFVKTFGCQMNVYDSERMTELLASDGYAETGEIENADLIVLNTCHIREKAVEKVYSDLGRIRQIKDDRKSQGLETTITVAGCVAQAEGSEILKREAAVDLVIGPQSYHRLPELIGEARTQHKRIVETAFPDEDKFEHLPERTGTPATTAFLTVQEGCDKFCTFCVVPYTRGMEYSRSVATLTAEVLHQVKRGVREITLLGQNVNAYHGEGLDGQPWPLAKLIRHLAGIDGVERLRYMTSHPRDMSDDLIAAHRDVASLMPFLHLPFQAGSDRILAGMNRKHTAAEYRNLIDRIRRARPDIALSTDVMVGFPGETDAEFEETLAIVRDIGFAQAFSFKYSARPGTPAAKLCDQVPESIKTQRLHVLQNLILNQQTKFNTACVGKTLPVLFEKPGRRAGQLVGRSPYLQPVHAPAGTEFLGRIIPVEISETIGNSLSGVICPA